MAKEVNLGDYITGVDVMQNRTDFWRALAALQGQRAHTLYVPDPLPGVIYQMNLLATDKPTTAQLNAGETGDSVIARFLVNWDVEIYGDGVDHSVLSFGTDDPTLQFAGLKVDFPYSLILRGVRVTNRSPMTLASSPFNRAIYFPAKTGNPTTQRTLRIEKAKLDNFAWGIDSPSGAVNSINYVDHEIIRSEIRAQINCIGIFSDPNSDGTKTLYTERNRLYNTNKNSGFGSHLIYAHPHVSYRSVKDEFYEWAAGKFALQHWGTQPNGRAKYAEFENPYFDKSGDGSAVITSHIGPTLITGGIAECRQGIEARERLTISDFLFRPKPSLVGTIALISTPATAARVTVRNIECDMSYIGASQATIFGVTNNNGVWDIDGAKIYSNVPTPSLVIFGTAANIVGGQQASVRAKHVYVDGYHVPDVDHAAGIVSNTSLLIADQGNFVIEDSYCKGDMVVDRGTLRFDPGGVLQSVYLDNVEILANRGLVGYVDPAGSDKLKGRRLTLHGGRLQLVGSAFQRLRFNEATTPTAITPTVTRKPTDWLAYNVLAISTDYDTVRLTGTVGAPPVDVEDICVTLKLKTAVKPAAGGNPAVTYTDVFSSEDTDNFVDAPLQILSDVDWLWRGTLMSAGKPFNVKRSYGKWDLA